MVLYNRVKFIRGVTMRKFLTTITALMFSISLYTCASAATPMSENIDELIQKDREQIELKLNAIDDKQTELEIIDLTDEEKQFKMNEYALERQKIVNTIGTMGSELYLTEGFEALYTSTFNETKTLSFDAPEGTVIQIIIVDSSNNQLFIGEPASIGSSRMLDVTLDLKGNNSQIYDEDQFSFNNIIQIFVRYDGNDYARQYEVNKKPVSTKNELETFDAFEMIQPIEQDNDQGGQNEENNAE